MNADIDKLLVEIERTAPPATLDRVRALVAALLDAHAEGLAHVMALLDARGDTGRAIAKELVRDRAVEGLLLLHGLHPHALGERVRAAIDGVAPGLRAQGAVAEILVADDGKVAIRIDAIPGGSPRATVRSIIETAVLDAAPEAAVEISLGFDDAATFVPVSRLGVR